MPSAPAPLDAARSVDAIVDTSLGQVLRSALAVRAVAAPVIMLVALFVAWLDPAPWRVGLMGTVVVVALVASVVVEVSIRRRGLEGTSVPANVVGTALLQVAMIVGTGGVDSPLLPVMIPVAILVSLALGRRRVTVVLLATQLACIAAMTVVQVAGVGPELDLAVLRATPPPPAQRVLAGSVVGVVVLVGGSIGLGLRHRFERMVATGVEARGEQLATWVAWSRELELLGGEIAHELKNPLASIKGLAALLARDVPEGRASERLSVLEGEVARMQAILDEFLTFSRPLTPLTVEELDPEAVCGLVLSLHEGVARSREVELRGSGEAARIRADRRKVVQILVNLLQNALAVAPAGTAVELRVSPTAGGVAFEIADRGPGIPAALRERAFEPGVTSRADGSGLGLTIARAIARQHGGDVILADRPGGGTIARATLPSTPAEAA